jgi:hypothetical protein
MIIASNNRKNRLPVEVKAGTKGAMQSMFLFLSEKRQPFGIRCSIENFGEFQQVEIYPLYAAGKLQSRIFKHMKMKNIPQNYYILFISLIT